VAGSSYVTAVGDVGAPDAELTADEALAAGDGDGPGLTAGEALASGVGVPADAEQPATRSAAPMPTIQRPTERPAWSRPEWGWVDTGRTLGLRSGSAPQTSAPGIVCRRRVAARTPQWVRTSPAAWSTTLALFMDRHDLPGLTPQEVAQAHVMDLETAGRHHVRFLSYWFDPSRSTAFCLADAPSPEAMQAVHRESHGLVANEIISVSEDNILRFLGAIRQPADQTEQTSAFRTVLFTDLEGSTSLLEAVGQRAFMTLLGEHDLILRRAIVAAEGREVKHTGDGIMASFDDVGGSLTAAIAIRGGFEARNATTTEPELLVRIGLAAGEPVDHNDDLFGSTVNLASRLCQAAEPGHILVSELVRDLGVEKGFSFLTAQRRVLRGFPEPVAVFELERGPSRDDEATRSGA